MKKKTILSISIVVVLLAAAVLGFLFLLTRSNRPGESPKSLADQIRVLRRKLAFSSDPDRNFKLAQAAEGQGDWKNALYYYSYLSNYLNVMDPRKGYANYKEAYCYYQLEDYLRAKRSLEHALNFYPDMPQVDHALFLMAQIYSKFGDFDNADKTYKTIIRMFPYRAEEATEKQQQLPQYLGKKSDKPGPKIAPTP